MSGEEERIEERIRALGEELEKLDVSGEEERTWFAWYRDSVQDVSGVGGYPGPRTPKHLRTHLVYATKAESDNTGWSEPTAICGIRVDIAWLWSAAWPGSGVLPLVPHGERPERGWLDNLPGGVCRRCERICRAMRRRGEAP